MSTSTAMTKRLKSKKEKKPAVGYLQVKFSDNSNPKAFKFFDFKAGLTKVERYLASVKGKWEFALLRKADSNQILYYYHPETDIDRLDKEAYTKIVKKNSYSLYIIPTAAYKRKIGNHKGTTQKVSSLDKVADYYNENVLRIDVYQKGSKINSFVNGKFLK